MVFSLYLWLWWRKRRTVCINIEIDNRTRTSKTQWEATCISLMKCICCIEVKLLAENIFHGLKYRSELSRVISNFSLTRIIYSSEISLFHQYFSLFYFPPAFLFLHPHPSPSSYFRNTTALYKRNSLITFLSFLHYFSLVFLTVWCFFEAVLHSIKIRNEKQHALMNTTNTCSFTYIRTQTNLPVHTMGVEQTWDQLKTECRIPGDGLPSPKYYKTIGPGPEAFAVVGTAIFYQVNGEWHVYKSATNIEHGTVNLDE